MAKANGTPALVRLAAVDGKLIALEAGKEAAGSFDVKFGKTDRIIKLPWPKDNPTGVLFVGRSGRTFVADFSRYPDTIKAVMVFHGSKQKLGDEYADLDTEEDSFEAVIALDSRLADGKWDAERQGFAGISVLMKALMKAFNLTEDAARDFLKPLSAKEKSALRADPAVKPFIDEIEKERGKGADVGGLVAKLKQMTEGRDQPQS